MKASTTLIMSAVLVLGAAAISSQVKAASGPIPETEQIAKLTPSDPQEVDFGKAVAIDGRTAAIGAQGDLATGVVYVFEQDPLEVEIWTEVVRLAASDGEQGDQFGSALAISKDTMLVGAPQDDDLGFLSGSAYVFSRNAGGPNAWGEVAKLTAADGQSDFFGIAVAISGMTGVIIGTGIGHVFEPNAAGEWTQTAELVPSDSQSVNSVAIRGDTIVLGSPGAGEDGSGLAHVFERGSPAVWTEVATLEPSEGVNFDAFFGGRVGVVGDTVMVTAPSESAVATFSGAVYVFERNAGGPDAWGLRAKLLATDGAFQDGLGGSAGLWGDRVVAGSPFADTQSRPSVGAVYVFERDLGGEDAWGQAGKAIASDGFVADGFAESSETVSIHRDTLLVGARDSAYVFELPPVTKLFFLSATGVCPGETTISVSTPLPNQDVTIFVGTGEGTSYVFHGACAGTELDLASARRWRSLTSDENGEASITRIVPSSWCGRYLQAVDRTCSTSDVARMPEDGMP